MLQNQGLWRPLTDCHGTTGFTSCKKGCLHDVSVLYCHHAPRLPLPGRRAVSLRWRQVALFFVAGLRWVAVFRHLPRAKRQRPDWRGRTPGFSPVPFLAPRQRLTGGSLLGRVLIHSVSGGTSGFGTKGGARVLWSPPIRRLTWTWSAPLGLGDLAHELRHVEGRVALQLRRVDVQRRGSVRVRRRGLGAVEVAEGLLIKGGVQG